MMYGDQSKIARLKQAFKLDVTDRPPILEGWLAAPEHVWTITGGSSEDYWEHPFHWGLLAERKLGSDGLVSVF
ncbi:hypothetical protein ACFLXI_01020 [Chloroflexota bacterium]